MPVQDSNIAQAPKRRIPIWFIVLVLIMLGLTFFGDRGILHVWKAGKQKTELEKQVAALEQINVELRQEIDALRTDLKTIEALARRELGMVRDDEKVYQFPAEESRQQPADSTD